MKTLYHDARDALQMSTRKRLCHLNRVGRLSNSDLQGMSTSDVGRWLGHSGAQTACGYIRKVLSG